MLTGARFHRGVALAGALALTAMLPVAFAAAAASPTACRVRNVDTGITNGRLQRAINLARPGDELTVRGVCHGATRIGKSLRITGIRTATSGRPTLDGDDAGSVITLDVGARVTILRLAIRDGTATDGGGIHNHGRLYLRDVAVRDSTATYGGGAHNSGTLVLNGSSSIAGNDAGSIGGGVYNDAATLTLNGSSSIWGNTATYGGGVMNLGSQDRGRLTLNGSSSIRGNSAANPGGGVFNEGGFLIGVVCTPEASANVFDNTPDDCYTHTAP